MKNKRGLFVKAAILIMSFVFTLTLTNREYVFAAEKSRDNGDGYYSGKTVIIMSADDKKNENIEYKIKKLSDKFREWGAEVLTIDVDVNSEGDATVDVTGDFASLLSLGNGVSDAESLVGLIIEKGFSNVKIIIVDEDTVVDDLIEEYSVDDRTADVAEDEKEAEKDTGAEIKDGEDKNKDESNEEKKE
ncbi:MAG: hypothetical protein IKP31_02305, partial [Lachnospiraceae bacterium]|nr:hypothetical protein [Lachnospiraceae bacterium]